jgi:hypothetical protein
MLKIIGAQVKLLCCAIVFGIGLAVGRSVMGFTFADHNSVAHWDPPAITFLVFLYAAIAGVIALLPALALAVTVNLRPGWLPKWVTVLITARIGIMFVVSACLGIIIGVLIALIHGPLDLSVLEGRTSHEVDIVWHPFRDDG